MAQRFFLVDVFAERAYGGNPLAVVLDEPPLPDATMQALAAEFNFSETTFVPARPEADGGWRVRLFTPAREIAFAGHPILGTAAVLRDALAPGAPTLRLNLQVGAVTVRFEGSGGRDLAWFDAPQVTPGAACALEPMAAALGIAPHDIDTVSPVQQMAAGTAAMIVPLRSLDALRRCRLDLGAYAGLAAQGCPPLVYVFCSETRDAGNDLSARFFFEAHGVREDPATGNGAAFLGNYLLAHGLRPPGGFTLRIEQGHELGRPSLVLVQCKAGQVSVGGSVIAVARGELADS